MTGQCSNPSVSVTSIPAVPQQKTITGQSSNPSVSVTSVTAAPLMAPLSTHVQQIMGPTTHHQQKAPVVDTESSIIDELLELTSDEEFMSSSSWNSPLLPEISVSVPSLQLIAQPQVSQTTASVSQPSLQQSTAQVQLQQLTIPVPHLPQQSITPDPQPVLQQFTPVPQLAQQTMPQQPPLQQSTSTMQQSIPVPRQPSLQQMPQQPSPQQSTLLPQQPSPTLVPQPSMQQSTEPIQPTNSTQTLQPAQAGTRSIAQPPFSTPPKLLPVERVMMDYPGTDEASLRRLTTALAREAIFGRDALCRSSLSGKNNTGSLEKHKLEYIKAVVKSRVPNMPGITFEGIWSKCRASLSKSCQTLRTTAKKKILS